MGVGADVCQCMCTCRNDCVCSDVCAVAVDCIGGGMYERDVVCVGANVCANMCVMYVCMCVGSDVYAICAGGRTGRRGVVRGVCLENLMYNVDSLECSCFLLYVSLSPLFSYKK